MSKTLQYFSHGALYRIVSAGDKWIMECPSCHRDFMLPHRIAYDVDGITALNPNPERPNSIICGYDDCRYHFHLRGGIAAAA